ncbi:MAG: RluA family pseudouridine synthase [Clostridiales bacterium]|jgi:23S rRNA pseudouridine1911/1915/1917 synthase|nr:RluA family pseudouridine synthase [Clostridiales bacterium]
MEYEFIVENGGEGRRFDVYLTERIEGATRSYVKSLIDGARATVNGAVKKAGLILKAGDVLYARTENRSVSVKPEAIPLDIIYQDGDFAVINKPQGMVAHPARGAASGTLVNALLFNLQNLSDLNGEMRPGIVHRLDKDTSGLILAAKNNRAHLSLSGQIAEKSARRYYTALLDGAVKADEGIVETFIGRNPKNRLQMCVTREGRRAVTLYKVIKRFREFSLVEFELKTGRTHQIRVHSKHIGHPVTGDGLYGGSMRFKTNGQLLHAHKLIVAHPVSGEILEFYAPLPDYFQAVLKKLGNTEIK